MTPYNLIFVVYPLITILITVAVKFSFRTEKANIMILLFIYVTANVFLFMLVEGAFFTHQFQPEAKGIKVFSGLVMREWLRIVFIPSVFTFFYLILSFVTCYIFDKGHLLKNVLQKRLSYRKYQ
ncbi:hypothetical protein LS684_05180 [Cytobacillus spongiae]|jgi:hypothetical protein|uniref:hypothetical protein n=1 Tax=Cytobacillus spongiae TaxID=2901381 RepID=UPI001F361DFC|nr:hypothetical protein [Cytobacillus spongiae]UII56834.1 hypothetical protein LS684_05180 [Cytobacillus spongiae]